MFAKSLLGTAFVTLVSLATLTGNSYAQITWDGGAATTAWEDAANWNPDGVPGAGDDVLINTNVTIDVSSAVTLATYEQTTGTVQGAGSITITGDGTAADDFDWRAGTIGVDVTVNASATALFHTTTSTLQANTTITLNGNTSWTGGTINGAAGSEIINNAIWTHSGTGGFNYSGAPTPTPLFTNNDTYNYTNPSGTPSIYVEFDNPSGSVVNITQGTFWLRDGGTSAGTYNVASNTTLRVGDANRNGSYSFGGTIAGDGKIEFNHGSGDPEATVSAGTYTIAITELNSSGTTRFTVATTFATLIQGFSSRLIGDAALTVTGSHQWNSGTLDAELTLANTANGTFASSTKTLAANRTYTANGNVTWTGGTINGSPGTEFINNATWTHSANTSFSYSSAPNPTPKFTNNDTYNYTNPSSSPQQFVVFDNPAPGVVNITQGTFYLRDGGTSTGTYNIASNTFLRVGDSNRNAGYSFAGTIAGAGEIQFNHSSNDPETSVSATTYTVTTTRLNNSGSTRFTTARSFDTLIQESSSTLIGDAGLTVTGTHQWRQGTLNGDLTLANTATALLEFSSKTLAANSSYTANGDVTWTGGSIFGNPGTEIINNAIWSHTANVAFTYSGTPNPTPRFTNNDTYNYSNPTSFPSQYVVFDNPSPGVVNITQGTFYLRDGGTSAGTYNIAVNTFLRVGDANRNGAYSFGGTIAGDGEIQFNHGSGDPEATVSASTYTVRITRLDNAGSTRFTTAQSFHTLIQESSSTLSGDAGLTVTDTHQWRSGTLNADLTLANTATALFESSTKTLAANRTYTANGDVTWTAGSIFGNPGTEIVNNATWTHSGNTSFTYNGTPNPTPLFTNNDTYNYTNPSSIPSQYVIFDNASAGTVNITQGTFYMRDGGTSTGTYNVSTNTFLRVGDANRNGAYSFGGTIAGNGEIQFNHGSGDPEATVSASTYTIQTTRLNNSGSTRFTVATTFDVLIQESSSTLNGDAALTVTGTHQWRQGTLNADLTLANTASGLFEFSTKTLAATRTYTANGDIAWTAGNILGNAGSEMVNNATMTQSSTGVFTFSGTPNPHPIYTNNGTHNYTNPTSAPQQRWVLDNGPSGFVDVQQGIFQPRDGGTNEGIMSVVQNAELAINTINTRTYTNADGGLIQGDGLVDIDGPFVNNGAFGPGTSAGQLDVEWPYDQTSSTSSFNAEVGGTTPGTEHDRLDITGSATLGGTINATIIDGFSPTNGQSFVVLTATDGVNGTFTNENTPGFNVIYNNNDVTLQATVVDVADLGLAKSVSDDSVDVGTNVTFTVVLTNDGPNSATSITIDDALPNGLTFVSATTSSGTYNDTNGEWTLGSLANGSSDTLRIVATVASAGTKTNTASVGSLGQADNNASNDSASAEVTGIQVDIGIAKSVDNTSAGVGEEVTFTVTVTNNGPSDATGVEVTDQLPAGLTYVSDNPSQGTYNDGTGVWTVGDLGNGDSATLEITATVGQAGTLTNTAALTAVDQQESNSGNNSASASVSSEQSDIGVSKTVSADTVNVGDNVTFMVTVTNNGPSDATGLAVTDQLPTGLTYVSDNPSQGSFASGSGVWTVGGLANGANATLQLVATMESASTLTNVASVTAVDQPDPDNTNDSDSTDVTGLQVDIALAKSVDNANPDVGQNVTFTVTATNNGPDDATGVEVTDLLPAGLTYVSDTPSQGTYVAGTGIWTVGNLDNGANATLDIEATVDSSDTITNTASVTAVDQADSDGSNDTASQTVSGTVVDVAMTKSVDNANPTVGTTITFTVTATNNGPGDATGVEVTDQLPVGLTYVSHTVTQGTYTIATGVWAVGSQTSAQPDTLVIVATADEEGTVTNTASVTGVDQADSDGSNDAASQSVTISAPVVDIAMTKTVDDANPTVGESVTFTVAATNNGPGDATGVEVTDQLPNGLTYVSHTTTQGTYTSGTGIWDLGSQANGQADTLVIVATVDAEGTVTNTATVTAVDQTDSDDTNDSASQAVTGGSGGVAISGIVLDVSFDESAGKTGEFAGFVETPLAGVLVELFGDNEPIGSTTTDTQGAFSFEQAGKAQVQVYELRFLGARTVPESGEAIEVRKIASDVQMGTSMYRLPVALFVQKYSLMYLLTNLTVPPVMGTGEPMSIQPQYDESGAQSLLANWSANVGADREGITNALARLWMAEYALSGLYNDAVWMANETSYIMFKLLRGFLIAQSIAADIQRNATPQLDRWLQRQVTNECFRGIEFLIRRAFVDEPAKRALAALPPNCSTTIQEAIQSMTAAATKSDLVATTDAVSNAIMKQGSENILARYLRGTQKDLDRSVEVSGLFQYTGTADAAYSQVQQIIQGSNQSTTSAHELADFLQQQTNYDEVLQKVISHIGRQPNVGNYVSLSRQLRKAKFGAFGRAVGVLLGRLKDIERADSPAGTGLAFDPGATKRPIVVVDNNMQESSAKSVADNLRAAIEPFRQKVSEISTAFAEGRREDAFSQYDELITLDANLQSALFASQAPIIASAEAASGQVAGFDDSFDALTDAISGNQIERAILYGQMLQIANDASITADSIATQADSVFQSLDNAEASVTNLTNAVQGVQARPYVAVTGIAFETNLVNLGDTLRVSVTIENQGDSSADGVVVTLAPDSSAMLLTAESFDVGSLAAAETRTLEWELEIVDGDEALRSFQVDLISDNALTIPGTGTYNVALITNTAVEPIADELPTEFSLHQSYPNPFNPSTTIAFSIPISGHVVIKVYDILGREIATLVDEVVAAGTFETQFDAEDLPSGAYLYRMQSGDFHATKSTILLK